MAIRVFDFRCADGHVHEHFVQPGTERLTCDTCGADAVRLMPATRTHLDSASGDFPGATMKWERDRASRQAAEAKHIANHGETRTGHRPGEFLGNTIGKSK